MTNFRTITKAYVLVGSAILAMLPWSSIARANCGSKDLAAITERIHDSFKSFAQASSDNPAPGYNAANGYFRNAVINSDAVDRYRDALTWKFGGDVENVRIVAYEFFSGLNAAFEMNANAKASGLTDSGVWQAAYNHVKDDLDKAIALYALSVAAAAAGQAELAGPLESAAKAKAAEAVSRIKRDTVTSGTHANGHIAADVRRASEVALKYADDELATIDGTRAGQVGEVLVSIIKQFRDLPVADQDPWLSGVWQGRFEGLSASGAEVFLPLLTKYRVDAKKDCP